MSKEEIRKPTNAERVQILDKVEELFNNYCRAGCPHHGLANGARSPVCITCPIGVELKGYGQELIPSLKPKKVNTKKPYAYWTEEEEAYILRERNKGRKYREIAQELGRTTQSVTNKGKRLLQQKNF